jgi:hypothetical protein
MKSPEEHFKEAKDWQQPFLDLLNHSFLGDKEKVEYGDLQITRDGKRFRLSLITKTANPNNSKDVGVKEKFLCFDMYRLSLTQEEALQALAEFKTLGEFVNFSLVKRQEGKFNGL